MTREELLDRAMAMCSNAAFPQRIDIDETTSNYGLGLTMRELFAAMAMQAIATARPNVPHRMVADDAVKHADALIAALNEGGEA